MRILVVSESFYPLVLGGGLLATWRILNALSRRGHEVTVVTSQQKGTPEYEMVAGIKIYRPFISYVAAEKANVNSVASMLSRTIFTIRLYFYLKEFLRRHPVDLIYTYAYTAAMPATYLAFRNRLPAVTSVRNLDGKTWFQQANPLIASFGYLMESLSLRYLGRHSLLHCPSKEVAQRIKRYTKTEAAVIPNPVDPDEINQVTKNTPVKWLRQQLGIGDGDKFLLFAGPLIPVKNVDGLINALSNLDLKNIKLILIGDGPERPKIEKQIKQLNLERRIIMLGQKSHAETLAIMQSCDIVILPSKSEVFPNVVLEALALGKPVLSSCVGGVNEIKSENLYLVNSLNELSQLLENNIEPKPEERILREYSLDRIADEFERLFTEVIKRNEQEQQWKGDTNP